MSGSRRRRGMPHVHGSEVNVTPLIDVVMCLIIFFMLVAKIGVSTGSKPMDLPETVIGRSLDKIPDTLFLDIRDPNLQRGADDKPLHKDPANKKSDPERIPNVPRKP